MNPTSDTQPIYIKIFKARIRESNSVAAQPAEFVLVCAFSAFRIVFSLFTN